MDRNLDAHRSEDLHHNKDEYSAMSEIIQRDVSNAGTLPQNQELCVFPPQEQGLKYKSGLVRTFTGDQELLRWGPVALNISHQSRACSVLFHRSAS